MSKQAAASAASEKAPEIFDVAEFRTDKVGLLTIRHPITNAPTTWIWQVAGPAHEVTLEQSERITRKSLREGAAMKQAQVNNKKWHEDPKEPAVLRQENAEFFAERVLGWSPVRINGEDFPYSRDNVIKVLLDPEKPGIFAQVIDYFRADENFMKRSAPTS